MLFGKKIVLGVTGGIAAYKALDIVSKLKKKRADVKVIMTKSALELVKPISFQTISQNYVYDDMFKETRSWDIEHISLAKEADLFLIAPATANIIGKIANGIADDMLSTTVMATRSKVVFAPAMNTNMYTNPIVKENIEKLKEKGYYFIGPSTGNLACGEVGIGRLEDIDIIIDNVCNHLKDKDKKLRGKKIVVTAGPTIERLDPVRYMTNNSSGKMGYSIAVEAQRRGAEVVLISGPTSLEIPMGLKFIPIETTEEMFEAVEQELRSEDILIKAAAPLDYRPSYYSEQKVKKSDDVECIEFEKNIDILKYFGDKKEKTQILVGFAAESTDLIKNAKNKMIDKNLDFIVANNIKLEDSGFKSKYNTITIIEKNGTTKSYDKMLKEEVSAMILNKIEDCIEEKAR